MPHPNVAQRYKADINDKVFPAGTVLPWNVTYVYIYIYIYIYVAGTTGECQASTPEFLMIVQFILPLIIEIFAGTFTRCYVFLITAILYYTLRTQFPHSLLIYEHNAHAMTLCGVHARKHVYMYGGPHVC